MVEKAYIGMEQGHWVLVYGDGSEDEKHILAVGREFEPGFAIQEAMVELEQWAEENGFELDAPLYSTNELGIMDVVEQEVFDEVFGEE